jgi:phosphoribosyl 1,2-cyclic phosphate phosphodiesterase
MNGLHILIDCGPDFRQQAFQNNIQSIDALLITHHHSDHVCGLDDLRPYFFYNPTEMPVYANPEAATALTRMFPYIFEERNYPGVAPLAMVSVEEPFTIKGRYPENAAQSVTVIPIPVFHGKMQILGYRIGKFAYLTDVSNIPESSFALLDGLDVLILDALRQEPHHSHFSIQEAVDAAQRIGAKQTYFTHITHTVLHERENANLPKNIAFGYDGLCVR